MELANLKNLDQPRPRVAILGIGNPLNGDDAVGGFVVDKLKTRLTALGQPGSLDLLSINTGPIPENFTGSLRKFSPDLIIMVDAARIDDNQDAIQWIPMESIAGFSASTHGMPLSLLASFLVEELKCGIGLIGIRAHSTDPGLFGRQIINPDVKISAYQLVRFLARELTS